MQTKEELRNEEAFRAIINRIINDGEVDLCERYMHPQMVIRRYGLASISTLLMPDRPAPPDGGAIEGFKAGLKQIRAAFPDWTHHIESVVAKDDRVSGTWTLSCTHLGTFMGLPPTQRPITMSEAGFMRFADGRMIEGWFIGDGLALAQQLGIHWRAPTVSQ
ncbi:ester cyclase [Paraburkholderia hospita]|uniref:ester cyclase n=1 Tax=Paraburkholderia hospita TaxID=169430 RepID=UPI0009A67E5F|nr:ester cyclase [Paraburkholderia hospita]SKC93354.1 SnoaL-like polyketide cyclase [Paraburkholderia hospita]